MDLYDPPNMEIGNWDANNIMKMLAARAKADGGEDGN